MDDGEAVRAAVLASIRAETEAWLRRDYATWATHWVHSPQTRRLEAWTSLGVRVDEGWDAIAARFATVVERFPEKRAFAGQVRWEKVNVVVDGTVAWVTFDQIGGDTHDDRKRQLRILHWIDGAWRIACAVVMECTVEEADHPLVEVDADARIVWTNRQAEQRLRDHPGLVSAAGRLRARHRDRDAALGEAIRAAHHELRGQRPLSVVARQAWAVSLGEGDAAAPLLCWVLLEDGRVLASFDNAAMVEKRIAGAAEVFGLSPSQTQIARKLVDGHDLSAAAAKLGVSVNTVRTQLQRMFDKTGVRSQAALIRAVLSADAPRG